MALELSDGKLTCTNPPNFCGCASSYQKVDSLKPIASKPVVKEGSSIEKPVVELDPIHLEPMILAREPLGLYLRNAGKVTVFDDARNKENEKRRFDWPNLAYYYLPQLTLTTLSNGDVAEVPTAENMSLRIAIDTGGTFTDVVAAQTAFKALGARFDMSGEETATGALRLGARRGNSTLRPANFEGKVRPSSKGPWHAGNEAAG